MAVTGRNAIAWERTENRVNTIERMKKGKRWKYMDGDEQNGTGTEGMDHDGNGMGRE